MSSSKVSLTSTESTDQTPSILNNNYIKIGGAVFVFIIFVIILYRSFSSSPPSKRRIDRFACILYPACDFLDSISGVNKDLLIKQYPDIDVNMVLNHKSIHIANIDYQEFHNVYIQSIRSTGYIITAYDGPEYFGEKYIFQDDKKTGNIEIKCSKPLRSIKIKKDEDAIII
jgi:hypothetical protein